MTTASKWMKNLRNTYSQRNPSEKHDGAGINSVSRFRVIKLCKQTVNPYTDAGSLFYYAIFDGLEIIYGKRIGEYISGHRTDVNDLFDDFLMNCEDHQFFDFIELLFQTQVKRTTTIGGRVNVGDINEVFDMGNLPYYLTDFVYYKRDQDTKKGSPVSRTFRRTSTPVVSEPIHYPQIIRRDSEVLHQEAIVPTLTLLKQTGFEPANKEFLNALQDFREGDYQDCVRKCGDAFESVMKIICGKKSWNYPGKAEGVKLLNIIIPNTNLDSHYKKLMQLIPIIRNNCAHGAGETLRVVPKHEAQFMINATASAILLLVEETSTSNGRN